MARKWVLRVGLGVLAVGAAAGAWAWTNAAELKAGFAARSLRSAATDADRAAAADRLAALGDPGLDRLVGFVRGGDEPTRAAAAAAVGRVLTGIPDGDPRADAVAGRLLDAFDGCDDGGRRAVLELLPLVLTKTGAAHADRCRAAVAAGLRTADPAVRVLTARVAIHPDVRMRPEVLPLLAAPEAEVRRAALFAVAASGEEQLVADEDLFRYLHDPDAGVRQVCRDVLVGRDRSAADIDLGRRLADPDPLERLDLLLDLRYGRDVADPEPWLERLSRDPEPAVRAAAARVAVEVTVERRLNAPAWVGEVAGADPDGTVRRVAGYFHRNPPGRVDPNVRPATAP
ncbi:MAG: hypothetical protein C0501_20500 [Isosphaera sp.]|nr:hypothetical protein [Isosphaera sp.]